MNENIVAFPPVSIRPLRTQQQLEVPKMSHFIPVEARPIGRNRYRAECGAVCDGSEHDSAPTCPDCARALKEDEATLASMMTLLETPCERPVKHIDYDATSGYVPRGQKRTR